MNINKSNKHIKPTMPRQYSDDLRWQAIWIKGFLGCGVETTHDTFRDYRVNFYVFFPTTFLETAVYSVREGGFK